MKKDLFFLVFVVLVGFAGLVYTNNNSKTVLVKKSDLPAFADEGTISSNSDDESYKKIKSRKANLDIGVALPSSYSVSDTFSLPSTDYSDQIDRVLNKSDTSSDEIISNSQQSTDQWGLKSDYWKLTLIDLITAKTKIDDVFSSDRCKITFEFSGGDEVILDLTRKIIFEVEENAIRVKQENLNDLELSHLKDGVALRVSFKELTDLCLK